MRKENFGFCLFYREPSQMLSLSWRFLPAVAQKIRDYFSKKPGFDFKGQIIITLDSSIQNLQIEKELIKNQVQYTLILPSKPFFKTSEQSVVFLDYILQSLAEIFRDFLNPDELQELRETLNKEVIQNPEFAFVSSTDFEFSNQYAV
jgi:hypothetical protein